MSKRIHQLANRPEGPYASKKENARSLAPTPALKKARRSLTGFGMTVLYRGRYFRDHEMASTQLSAKIKSTAEQAMLFKKKYWQ